MLLCQKRFFLFSLVYYVVLFIVCLEFDFLAAVIESFDSFCYLSICCLFCCFYISFPILDVLAADVWNFGVRELQCSSNLTSLAQGLLDGSVGF